MKCCHCKKVIPDDSKDDLCNTCYKDKLVCITFTEVATKYKLSGNDLKNIKTYGSRKYLLSDILALCEKLTKDLPETDKRKIAFKKQKDFIASLKEDNVKRENIKKGLIEAASDLLKKRNVDVQDKYIKELIEDISHNYAKDINTDVFKRSIEISEQVYNAYLKHQKELKKENELINSIKSLPEYNKYKDRIKKSKSFSRYVYEDDGTLEDAIISMKKEIKTWVELDAREDLLVERLKKDGLLKYKNDKRCKNYINGKRHSLDELIKEFDNEDKQYERYTKYSELAYKYSGLYPGQTVYYNYFNGVITFEQLEQEFIKSQDRMKRGLLINNFINQHTSERYWKCIQNKVHNNSKIKHFIENGGDFDAIKKILLDLEEECIMNINTLSDKWKTFLKNVNKDPGRIICKKEDLFNKLLFEFCDSDRKQILIKEKNEQNRAFLVYRCKQLNLNVNTDDPFSILITK